MGGGSTTVRNIAVARVEAGNNLLLLRGAIPGKRGTLVEITGM